MKIAVAGLGKMGSQIARKLSEDSHTVIGYNRTPEAVDEAVRYGAQPAYTKQDVVKAFAGEMAVLWIMIPTDVLDGELAEWSELLPKGSLIIDGGNSDYRVTQQRARRLAQNGFRFMDVGVSGGIWGYRNGFPLMVGGSAEDVAVVAPALASLTKPEGAYYHFGPSGSGHYVKMVHNAIEYGLMESLAEGYRLLKEGPIPDLNLYEASRLWQHHSIVMSWLNELTGEALRDNPDLSGIDGYVAETGEARWALETARSLDLAAPSIQAAFDVRVASQQGHVNFATKLLAAMRNKFGGHNLNKS